MPPTIRTDTPAALRAAILLCVLACAACGGSGEGLDQSGRPVGENPPPAGDDSQFTRIQQTVLTPVCTQCHQGATAPLGLRLDAANSYAMLVGAPSVQVPSLLRVEPGVPDDSYLVHKVQGTAAVGGRMPLGGPPLSQAAIDLIRSWIATGAPPPPSAVAGFAVKSSAPAPAETAGAPLPALTLVFSAPVDASLAAAGTVELAAMDGSPPAGGIGPEPRALPAGVAVSATNPTVVTVTPVEPLASGRYRLRIRGAGPTALADVHARVLDGDGDGAPGGDYLLNFEVEETDTR